VSDSCHFLKNNCLTLNEMFKKINEESGLFHAKAKNRKEYHRCAINQFFVFEGALRKFLAIDFNFESYGLGRD